MLRSLIAAARAGNAPQAWVLATLGRLDAVTVRSALMGDPLLVEMEPRRRSLRICDSSFFGTCLRNRSGSPAAPWKRLNGLAKSSPCRRAVRVVLLGLIV